jgi:hypothetical protein
MDILKEFDFSLLDSPDFKEDSVREEIIVPILKELGYSASGQYKITRSKTLTHPFVFFGTQPRKIVIIPDYHLVVNDAISWILDAKAPKENIDTGKNVEQAYSYAVHRDIKAQYYALSNGRKFVVFDMYDNEPVLSIDIKDLKEQWIKLENLLSPLHLQKPYLKEFHPDLGLSLLKQGFDSQTVFHFMAVLVAFIVKSNENLYVMNITAIMEDGDYLATFDFQPKHLQSLLDSAPDSISNAISNSLANAPFIFYNKGSDFTVNIEAVLTDEILDNTDEKYLPLKVLSIS